jgi:hypothetical protein
VKISQLVNFIYFRRVFFSSFFFLLPPSRQKLLYGLLPCWRMLWREQHAAVLQQRAEHESCSHQGPGHVGPSAAVSAEEGKGGKEGEEEEKEKEEDSHNVNMPVCSYL